MSDKSRATDIESARPSMLPFDPAQMMAIRVRPVDFARMVNVSKQAVSGWINSGKVKLGPDGRLDPTQATRQLIENSDPARLRAKVLKDACASLGELRDENRELRSQIEHSEQRVQAARFAEQDRAETRIATLLAAIAERFDEAQAAHEAGELADWFAELDERISGNG